MEQLLWTVVGQHCMTGCRMHMCKPCRCVACFIAGPDMSAAGMLTAINNARLKVLPPSPSSPGAAEWRLMEAGTPLAVTAIRAAAATGDREALLSTLQQQMTPIQPTPIEVQVGIAKAAQICDRLYMGLLSQQGHTWLCIAGIACQVGIVRLAPKMRRL